jgi:uncharacterized protein (TIGR03435 family)
MPPHSDIELLREYVDSGSEEAFSALVHRHLNLVYSAAMRRVGNPHQAEEICQAVFIILARKATRLPARTILSGWLYQTARLTAANYQRGEIRRSQREQEAHMEATSEPAEPDPWAQVGPVLDDAMAGLRERDRNAVLLRFFEGKSFQEVGACLGTSEPAAKMRVNRALEKLRLIFLRRGVKLSVAVLSGALTVHSVHAAPIGLTASVSAAALNGSAVGASTVTLIKTTLKLMAWTKAKTMVAVGTALLLTATTVSVSVEKIREYRGYPWQARNLSSDMLNRLPPQVRIVSARFPQSPSAVTLNDKILGLGHSVENILLAAYRESSSARLVMPGQWPAGRYDFIANLPDHSREALQQELQRKFGLIAGRQQIETNILRLTVKTPGASGLRLTRSESASTSSNPGQLSCVNQPLSTLSTMLEDRLQIPVIDETGLLGRFDIDLVWDESGSPRDNLESVKQALVEELGLELTEAKSSIDMLVVQQVR